MRGYITIKSASEILGVTTETLRRWSASGKLKSKRDDNGYRMYRIGDLEKFAQKNDLRRAGRKRNIV